MDTNRKLAELSTSNYEIAGTVTDITGWMVATDDQEIVGQVKELIFETDVLQVRYLVVELNFLDSSLNRVLIPIGIADKHPVHAVVMLPGVSKEQLAGLPSFTGLTDLTYKDELEVRRILEGASQAPYLHPQFYQHHHFDEGRFYDGQNTSIEEDSDQTEERHQRAARIVARLDQRDQEIKKGLNNVKQIHELYQQSIWLDFIDREIMRSGKLQRLISEDGVRGVTSNPAIFEQAISSSSDYDADITESKASDPEEIFYRLAVQDIRQAADLFSIVYNEEVSAADGYVSLEVSPLLALDEQNTLEQARRLWKEVDRKNVMIKIPGTLPCIPAINTAIAEGININVTLIFGLERYEKIAYAYIEGLESRLNAGQDISQVASVASFFLSRIDLLVDPLLEQKNKSELKGMAAISAAKVAYSLYQKIFSGERWQKLAAAGARPQRLLWASTGNKNPEYRDTRYVEELIGPDTVNTVPLPTLDAFRDHGDAKATLMPGTEQAIYLLEDIANSGIDMNAVAEQLEQEGIEKFKTPYEKLLQAITQKINDKARNNQTPMENSEKSIDVINDLIKINHDRVDGFEKAVRDLAEQDTELAAVFNRLAGESAQNATELTYIVQRFGGEPAEGTTTSGALHRAWLDIKAVFTGDDAESILSECERGEDAIKSAYDTALDTGVKMNPEVLQVLQRQRQGIQEGHDLIKSLRDRAESQEVETESEPAPGFPITEGSVHVGMPPMYTGDNLAPEPESIEQEEAWEEQQLVSTTDSKLMEFFINELKDLLWAERELAETLPIMAEAATSAELKAAFKSHFSETQIHVSRLEQIFGILGLEVESRKCDAMAGILDEGDEIISITDDGTAQRDVGLIFAGQKAEHYEIASYGGMIALAKTLGYYDIAETLVLTLDEEKTADAKLTEIAESQANYQASTEPVQD